jgi:hypothetical protein
MGSRLSQAEERKDRQDDNDSSDNPDNPVHGLDLRTKKTCEANHHSERSFRKKDILGKQKRAS